MGWLDAIWMLVLSILEFLGARWDWVREEIDSKPRKDVMWFAALATYLRCGWVLESRKLRA